MKKKTYSPFGEKLRSITLLTGGVLLFGFVQAQESANASGGEATGNGGNVAYSVGQVVYTTSTGSNGSIAQGVQHAYEIFNLGIEDTELNISLSIFPNPTSDYLVLQINDYSNEKLSYKLFDVQGKPLGTGQLVEQQTQINMNSLPTAVYFVEIVNQQNKKIQSYKIIKN